VLVVVEGQPRRRRPREDSAKAKEEFFMLGHRSKNDARGFHINSSRI
jgi:hypothetical protein